MSVCLNNQRIEIFGGGVKGTSLEFCLPQRASIVLDCQRSVSPKLHKLSLPSVYTGNLGTLFPTSREKPWDLLCSLDTSWLLAIIGPQEKSYSEGGCRIHFLMEIHPNSSLRISQ